MVSEMGGGLYFKPPLGLSMGVEAIDYPPASR